MSVCNSESKQNKSIDMKAKCIFYFSFRFSVCCCCGGGSGGVRWFACQAVCCFSVYMPFVRLPHFIPLVSVVFPLLHAYCWIMYIIKIHLYYIFKINILCAYEMERRKYKRASFHIFFSFCTLNGRAASKKKQRLETRILLHDMNNL